MRLLLAVVLAVALVLGTVVLLEGPRDADGDAGIYQVRITGPGGAHSGDLWNGTVELATGTTAYDALLAAAARAGLAVEVEEHPAYRPCGTYVTSIGDHAAGDGPGGSGGWVYEVHRDGAWTRPPVGACGYALQEGDQVWWRYVDA